MAALCTGISYGLSQSSLNNENKEVIFVKLTDSAYRAIEEYQKNQVSTISNDIHFTFPNAYQTYALVWQWANSKTTEIRIFWICRWFQSIVYFAGSNDFRVLFILFLFFVDGKTHERICVIVYNTHACADRASHQTYVDLR